jgi:hypothetical protein
MKRQSLLILVLLAVLTTSCASQLGYWAERGDYVDTPTGRYALIRTNDTTVQSVWKSRAKPDLKHLPVFSFIDTQRMEIWYTSTASLKEEIHNAQSWSNMRDAHERDVQQAYPLNWR